MINLSNKEPESLSQHLGMSIKRCRRGIVIRADMI